MNNTRPHGVISGKRLTSSLGTLTSDKNVFLKNPLNNWYLYIQWIYNLRHVTQFTAILTEVIFFYRSGKGISRFFFYWYWSATLIKFLYETYYKVAGATDIKITSTLYNQKNMKREALARNALNPLNRLSQCTEKKNKMIIVIKIFF